MQLICHYQRINQLGPALKIGEDTQKKPQLSDDELRIILATYYTMMSEVHSPICRLMDYFKIMRCYPNTVIIFIPYN
ncbi:MAG: hypothetical protein ACI9KM_001687 [Rubritalea sp.]|jgi:hypothetical protein